MYELAIKFLEPSN